MAERFRPIKPYNEWSGDSKFLFKLGVSLAVIGVIGQNPPLFAIGLVMLGCGPASFK